MGTPVLSRMQQKPSRGGSFDEDEEEGLSRFGCLESSAASSPAVTPRQRHILFEEEEEAGSPLMPP